MLCRGDWISLKPLYSKLHSVVNNEEPDVNLHVEEGHKVHALHSARQGIPWLGTTALMCVRGFWLVRVYPSLNDYSPSRFLARELAQSCSVKYSFMLLYPTNPFNNTFTSISSCFWCLRVIVPCRFTLKR